MENDKHISHLSSALIIPQTHESDFGRKPFSREYFAAGVMQNGQASKFFGHEYSNTMLQNSKLQSEILSSACHNKLTGTWFFAGTFAPHFGHFIAESCHRLWAWRQLEAQVDGLIFLPPPKFSDMTKWGTFVFDVLALFGIEKSQVKIVTDVTEVEKIYVPEQGASFHGDVKPWYQNWLAQNPLVKNFAPNHSAGKKLFISRKNYKLKGRVAGMDAFADFLVEHGYQEVRPESLGFEEQLAVLASAERIIWEEGSAVHLMELLPQQAARAALIMRRPTNPNIKNFLEKKYSDLYTDDELIMDQCVQSRGNNAQAYFANIDKTVKGLKQNGFIETTHHVEELKHRVIAEELEDARSYVKALKVSSEVRKGYIGKLRLLQKLRRLGLDNRHLLKRALFNNALRNGNNSHAVEVTNKIVISDKFSEEELSIFQHSLTEALANSKQPIQKENLEKAIAALS